MTLHTPPPHILQRQPPKQDSHRLAVNRHSSCQSVANRKTIVLRTFEQVFYRDRPKCLDGGTFTQSIFSLSHLPILHQSLNHKPIPQSKPNPSIQCKSKIHLPSNCQSNNKPHSTYLTPNRQWIGKDHSNQCQIQCQS